MSRENKTWESVKESYLKQVEAAIGAAGHPRLREILDDVNAHLEQKFAELAPSERVWENYQKIITEMGPASDYAELLGEKTISPHAEMGIWRRFFINAALSIAIIATVILLSQLVDRLMPHYGKQVAINEPNKPGEFAVKTYMTLQGRYVDITKYPFVNDPNVIGKWVSIDFVRKPEEFTPGQQRWQWGLFLKELQFFDGGTTQWGWQWTKGLLLSPNSHTASRYIIKNIDGEQYMFFEWKSGDYTILHRKPAYYVLKKEKEIDIKSSGFYIQAEPKGGVYNLVVSIKNESKAVIPKFKLKFFRGDPNNNLDETGNIHRGWHEVGPIEPGRSWNERTRYFHLPDGEYEFNVVLDFDNTVPEIDESNNRASLKVKILNGQIIK